MRSICHAIGKLSAVVIAAVFLGACSKATVTNNQGSAAVPSGNWDSLVWDQGSWS
jgi:hypothetical protein